MPQPTLAAFKFTKKVTVGDGSKNVDVNLPKTVPEKENIKTEACPKCDKQFVNKQGLGMHMKCAHAHPVDINCNLLSANKIPADSVNPGPSNGAVDKGYTFAPVENNAGGDGELEVVEIKDDKRRGADKRKVYEARL